MSQRLNAFSHSYSRSQFLLWTLCLVAPLAFAGPSLAEDSIDLSFINETGAVIDVLYGSGAEGEVPTFFELLLPEETMEVEAEPGTRWYFGLAGSYIATYDSDAAAPTVQLTSELLRPLQVPESVALLLRNPSSQEVEFYQKVGEGRPDEFLTSLPPETQQRVQVPAGLTLRALAADGNPSEQVFTVGIDPQQSFSFSPEGVSTSSGGFGAANLSKVTVVGSDAYFGRAGNVWYEFEGDGSIKFKFAVQGADETTLQLFDASRGVGLNIDIPQAKILLWSTGAPEPSPLYTIEGVAFDAATDRSPANLISVSVAASEGYFALTDEGWREFNAEGQAIYSFDVEKVGVSTLNLFDASRGYGIVFDLDAGEILLRTENGSQPSFLYSIGAVEFREGAAPNIAVETTSGTSESAPETSTESLPAPIRLEVVNQLGGPVELFLYDSSTQEVYSFEVVLPPAGSTTLEVESGWKVVYAFTGSDEYLGPYTVTEASRQRFQIEPTRANDASDSQESNGTLRQARPDRPAFASWLHREQPDALIFGRETLRESFGQAVPYGQADSKIKNSDQFRRGYNLLSMDPFNLNQKGTPQQYQIFAPPKANGADYYEGLYQMNIPNYLELYDALGRNRASTQRRAYLSSASRKQAKGWSIGMGAKIGDDKKAGAGRDSKLGVNSEDTSFQSQNRMSTIREKYQFAYWAVVLKKYLVLDEGFAEWFRDPDRLRTYNDFKKLFERHGTHWPLATLMGGWVIEEESFTYEEATEALSKSLSFETSATGSLKGVTLSNSFSYTQTNSSEYSTKKSEGLIRVRSSGGADPNFDYPNFGEPDSSSNLAPVAVELREVHELVWPELLGVENDAVEEARIDALRLRTQDMLDRYFEEAQSSLADDWKPRIYQASIDAVRISKEDDNAGGFNVSTLVDPGLDLRGVIGVGEVFNGKGEVDNIGALIVGKKHVAWESEEPVRKQKSETFDLKEGKLTVSVAPTAKVGSQVAGRNRYRPTFDTEAAEVAFVIDLFEEDTLKAFPAFKTHSISLAKVDEAGGMLNETVKLETDFMDLEMDVSIRRMRIELEPEPEPVGMPSFSDLGLLP